MTSFTSLSLARKCTSALRLRSRSAIGSSVRLQSSLPESDVTSSSKSDHSVKSSSAPPRKIKATNAPVKGNPNDSVNSREFSSASAASSLDDSASATSSSSNSTNMNILTGNLLDKINEDGSELTLEELFHLASQPCTPLSLSDMYKYASKNANSKNYIPQRLRNAQFLHKELPIRVAQRAIDLLTLPHGLNKTKEVQQIAHAYLRYLKKLFHFPCPQNEEEEFEFTNALKEIVMDRKTIPMAIARGVASLKDVRKEDLDVNRLQEMEKALYRFFNARTGLRLLAEHHILSCVRRKQDNVLFRKTQSYVNHDPIVKEDDEDFIGCIKDDCDPFTEVQRVADIVSQGCQEAYGIAPEIEVLDCTLERYAKAKFTYVPHHLQYTVAELLKNSCRATIRRHLEGNFTEEDHVGSHNNSDGLSRKYSLPSVKVVVAKGAEDVTIKIADKGGGVPRSVINKMWTFAHSTSDTDEVQSMENDTGFETDAFSGGKNIRGFGLPMARIYARYFGGELTLKSMEGYGVDAYLYLPVLGDQCENLPKRVLKSPANHDSLHDLNHHAYSGDVFSSSFLSGEEPWGGKGRHFSTASTFSFEKFNSIAI